MKIITQQIYHSKAQQVRKDLHSILNRWKWGNKPIKTSTEFLNKLAPWISEKIKEEKELAEFLKSKGVKSLSEL